jgi:hypothetical protein
LGIFKPGAKHPVTPAPIKALPCLCLFPPMAEKSKPPALRVVGDPEHYYGKRYKILGLKFYPCIFCDFDINCLFTAFHLRRKLLP